MKSPAENIKGLIESLKTRKAKRVTLTILSSVILLSTFQNCGTAFETASSSGNGETPSLGGPMPVNPLDPLAYCSQSNYTTPKWTKHANDPTDFKNIPIAFNIGLGDGGPAITYSRRAYSFTPGTGPVNFTCNDGGNTHLDVNCNNDGILIDPSDNVECVSGTATITAVVRDGCPGKTFDSRTFTVTYTNVCPAEAVLKAETPQQTSQYGTRVTIKGNYMVSTSPEYFAADGRTYVGAAHVHIKNSDGTWSLQQTIVPNATDAPAYQRLFSVDLINVSGNDYLAIGATGKNRTTENLPPMPGAVFIYQRSGANWVLQQKINQPAHIDVNNLAQFGYQVKWLSDLTLIASANFENVAKDDAPTEPLSYVGQVYIFNRLASSWSTTPSQIIKPSTIQGYDRFGTGLSASGNTLVVGSPANNSLLGQKDSVYIYTRTNGVFTEVKRIVHSAGAAGFGESVSTDGVRIAVGAASQNRVYIYNAADGSAVGAGNFQFAGVAAGDEFGYAVHIQGNTVFASAPNDNTGQGAIIKHVINADNTFTQQFKLRARLANRVNNSKFGRSFSVDGTQMAVGSPNRTVNSLTNAGIGFVIGTP